MHEFNLIPPHYQRLVAARRLLRGFALQLLGVALVLGAVWGGLRVHNVGAARTAEHLQKSESITNLQRDHMVQLRSEQRDLQKDWRLLQSLRSGMPAISMLRSIEAQLEPDQLWFEDWHFRRAGIVTAADAEPRPPSYFVLTDQLPADDDWQSFTHMSIRGQARDYRALTELTGRLLALEHVHDVRMQRTALGRARLDGQALVDFDLTVVVQTAMEGS